MRLRVVGALRDDVPVVTDRFRQRSPRVQTDAEVVPRIEIRRLQLQRDWGRTEARIRRRLQRPAWRLVTTLLIILACAVAGLSGVGTGWGIAIALSLAVLPGRVADVRARGRALAAVETAEDIRALCAKEADLAVSGTFVRSLLLGALGLLYVLTGLVAWLLDKSPWPGVLAGLVALAWSAVLLLVMFPRAGREAEEFEDVAEAGAEDDGGA